MGTTMKFQKALDQVLDFKKILNEDFAKEIQSKANDFMNEVQESQYIKVPLVGVFSAGKSSLLNVFTQRNGMLPVDTAPETAVAYELYYSPVESVELFREGKKIDEKKIENIKELDTKPGDIAKVYCQSDNIKKLQERGIILVDMPGIGSGIERHDAAIFNYIQSGTAFILIVDAEQGGLRNDTLVFMEELSKYNMHPAILVSKIDKKPENEVKDIVEYIEYQAKKFGNAQPFVSTVCAVNNDLSGLNKYLDTLDQEAIVEKKLGVEFKAFVCLITDHIKTRIEIRKKDITNVEEQLKSIEEEISNIKTELPQQVSGVDSPEKSTQDILDNIKAALEAKADDIAQMIIDKEDQETIKSLIISIIRSELITSIRKESEQYSEDLSIAVKTSIKGLEKIEISDDFMSGYEDLIKSIVPFIASLTKAGGIWGKILAFLLPHLPVIINWLFGKDKSEILEEVRQKVMDSLVNKIGVELKPTIYKMVVDNQKAILEKMQAEIVSRMESVKAGLKEKMADANMTKEKVESELAQLQDAINQLQTISDNI